MPFYAKDFIYNGIPSQFYGLKFGEIDASGDSTSSASNQISIIQQKIFKNPVPYLYGVEQSEVLEFAVSIMSEAEIPSTKYSEISSWLFGKQNYGILRIMQNDMKGMYYKCFFTEPETIRVGNMIQGFTATVVCDSPWAWKEPKTHTYYIATSPGSTGNFVTELYNYSANDYYTLPTSVIIQMGSGGGDIDIINADDNSRISTITGLTHWETITMNSQLQLISSDVERPESIINNFNLKWLRLIKGNNRLRIRGDVKRLVVVYPVAHKSGG
ncbi:hypothetical protein M0R04_15825 [Candidatus Dojkabacteria bacterium]|jgi:hypothetical protein|nr:hypothetical protein [Candidatus Dojkabacteria bacterium]